MTPKLPFFQFYPGDFLSDRNVMAMNTWQIGAFFILLCLAWDEDPHGTIPDDDELIAGWLRTSVEEWQKNKIRVTSAFTLKDGRWHQKRMMVEYQQANAYRTMRSANGVKGNDVRWHSDRKPIAMRSQPISQNVANQNQNQNQTKASSRARVREPASSANGSEPSAASKQAEHLLDLSEASIEGLVAEHPQLDVRALVAVASKRCAKRHPQGGPMKLPFFREFLNREEKKLDPPGLIETRKEKLAQMEEAVQDRNLTPDEEDTLRKQIAEELRKFRREKL
jgi:uncharacterized protein YdaU (DUF1376 family)